MFSDIWLGLWSIDYFALKDKSGYIMIYVALFVFLCFYIFMRDIIYQRYITAISNKMYLNSIDNVVNAEMNWHNQISLSKLIYRLTMDQSLLDDKIILDCMKLFEASILLIGGFIILNVFFFGYFLIISIIFFIITKKIIQRFLKISSIFLIKMNRDKNQMFTTYITALENVVCLRSLKEDNYFYPKILAESNKFQ